MDQRWSSRAPDSSRGALPLRHGLLQEVGGEAATGTGPRDTVLCARMPLGDEPGRGRRQRESEPLAFLRWLTDCA